MVNLSTAKLAGVIMVVGILAIAGTNLAFAQTCGTQGAQAYAWIGCEPLGTAQWYGVILVVGVVAFAIACGAAGWKHKSDPITGKLVK